MQSLEDFVNESQSSLIYLNQFLKKTGWPSLKIKGDIALSEDEDTTITFSLDEYDKKPYISKIECNFYTGDPNHLRDLKGLVELFEEINHI